MAGDSPYTIADTDRHVVVDATAGNIIINLQSASGNERRLLFIQRVDTSSNSVSVVADGSDLIGDSSSISLVGSSGSISLLGRSASQWVKLTYSSVPSSAPNGVIDASLAGNLPSTP